MPPNERFGGAGLYAIYYIGPLEYYAMLTPPRRPTGEIPIYVGRARPRGARQGAVGLEATTSESVLVDRLGQHARSIETVESYANETGSLGPRLADFRCRYLVADDIWVPLGEALLIGHYRPVWNVVVDGFGNHDPGGGRRRQARSRWDELHPGRPWATRLSQNALTAERIRELVERHLATTTSPDLDVVPAVDDGVRTALAGESEG